MDVVVVDLGLGNLHSVSQAIVRAGGCARITADPTTVKSADRIVVPGQGAFRECIDALKYGLEDALLEFFETQRPYLGICLGMQLLFEESEEAPGISGLGIISGKVVRFSRNMSLKTGKKCKVPHIGWSPVRSTHPFIDNGGWYYFVHSYHCVPTIDIQVAEADYGRPFCAALSQEAIFACQFHPEKSHHRGARLLERFLNA